MDMKTNGRCPVMGTLSTASRARSFELAGDIESRNEFARLNFKSKSHRKITHAGLTVETWFDGQSRNWITSVENDSQYSGHKDDAAVAHLWALYKILDRCENKHPFTPKN